MSAVKLVMRKDGGVLRPEGMAAWNDFDAVPNQKSVMVEVRRARNPQHHAKLWAIYQAVANNDDDCRGDAEAVHEWVKVRLRMFREYKDWDGRMLIRTKSINYESMDQLKFSAFYDRAMWVIGERIGVDPETLLDEAHQRAA